MAETNTKKRTENRFHEHLMIGDRKCRLIQKDELIVFTAMSAEAYNKDRKKYISEVEVRHCRSMDKNKKIPLKKLPKWTQPEWELMDLKNDSPDRAAVYLEQRKDSKRPRVAIVFRGTDFFSSDAIVDANELIFRGGWRDKWNSFTKLLKNGTKTHSIENVLDTLCQDREVKMDKDGGGWGGVPKPKLNNGSDVRRTAKSVVTIPGIHTPGLPGLISLKHLSPEQRKNWAVQVVLAVESQLKDRGITDAEIVLSGHSLGGALALWAGYKLKDHVSYTVTVNPFLPEGQLSEEEVKVPHPPSFVVQDEDDIASREILDSRCNYVQRTSVQAYCPVSDGNTCKRES